MSLATCAKVSKKSSPSSWVNPLATTLALWRSTVPSEWYLILYTYLQPIVFFPRGERGKLPSIVSSKSLKLILHGRLPRSMFGGFVICPWFRMRIDRRNNISKIGR